MNCNFATHATCLLELTAYNDSELQVFVAIQKLSCKTNCKTPLSLIVFHSCVSKFSSMHVNFN